FHDFNLSLDICKGLIPEIVKGTLPVYARLMTRCWDSDPDKRPTADELYQFFSFWYRQLLRVIESLLLAMNLLLKIIHYLVIQVEKLIILRN
ncbi:hypothetical protein RhiirB3_408171, partial [Rhizophagus irregularis]